MNALIGYTGFIGSNLAEQMKFNYMFNSKNIWEISHQEYETVICAGIPSPRWYANEHPKEDLSNIIDLTNWLKDVKCENFILISTIDVFEKTSNNPHLVKCSPSHHPYGFNRFYAEEKLKRIFNNKLTIIRLPAVFGNNLKKNVLFDLLNNTIRNKINLFDTYQWYDVRELSKDIQSILYYSISEINLFSEPISMKEIIDEFFTIDPEKLYYDHDSAILYDLISRVDYPKYWESKYVIMNRLKTFISEYGKS